MRYLPFIFAIAILAAGAAIRTPQKELQTASRTQAPASEQARASRDSALQFLLSAAASDFHIHGPSGPVRFREVRLGHVLTVSAGKQYRLCGQFQRTQDGSTSQWTPFATITTSGYELWIGAQGAAFCQDSSIVWDNVGELSSSLQSRFNSLR